MDSSLIPVKALARGFSLSLSPHLLGWAYVALVRPSRPPSRTWEYINLLILYVPLNVISTFILNQFLKTPQREFILLFTKHSQNANCYVNCPKFSKGNLVNKKKIFQVLCMYVYILIFDLLIHQSGTHLKEIGWQEKRFTYKDIQYLWIKAKNK